MPDMTLEIPTASEKPEVVGEKVWKGSCVFALTYAVLCSSNQVHVYICMYKNPGGTWAGKVHGFSPDPGELNLWHGWLSQKPRHPTEESLLHSAAWLWKIGYTSILCAQKFKQLFFIWHYIGFRCHAFKQTSVLHTTHLSLADKLEKCKKALEESYSNLATLLTEIQMEDLEKVDSSNPQMQEFLGRICFKFSSQWVLWFKLVYVCVDASLECHIYYIYI